MPIQTDSTINTYQYHQQYIPLHTNFNNQYIPIQQTIHTNTYQIIHTNTCQYRLILQSIHTNTDSNTYQYIPVNTYQYGRNIFNKCQYVHPPPPTTPSLLIRCIRSCWRCAAIEVHSLRICFLIRFHVRQFLLVLDQPIFPRLLKFAERWLCWVKLHDMIFEGSTVACRNLLSEDCLSSEHSHEGHKVGSSTDCRAQDKHCLTNRFSIFVKPRDAARGQCQHARQ